MAIETDLAYTAGIIDGEGYIGIKRHKKPEYNWNYNVRLQVTNTDKTLMDWLLIKWGGHIYSRLGRTERHAPQYIWTLNCQDSVDMLQQLLPYLVIKQKQAQLAIGFQNNKNHHRRFYGYAPRTESEMAIEEAEYILMHELKHSTHRGGKWHGS